MPIAIDPITRRKLILVKQLYHQAEKQSGLPYSISNRIMSVIGFDLTVETLLKVIVSTLDRRRTAAENLPGLLEQCGPLLVADALPALPFRPQVLHVHSIRNDAQHKAKYPNETDVSDCRTYVRDFCREVIVNCWGISFDQLSLLEWIEDEILRRMLEITSADIQEQKFKKALTLACMAFNFGSDSILTFLPDGVDGLYSGQIRELDRKTVNYINAVLAHMSKDSKYFAALMSTGINIVDYNRYHEATPRVWFMSSHTLPDKPSMRVDVLWQDKEPDEEIAWWVLDFVVNSIINWQAMGLKPNCVHEDKKRRAEILILWDTSQISMK